MAHISADALTTLALSDCWHDFGTALGKELKKQGSKVKWRTYLAPLVKRTLPEGVSMRPKTRLPSSSGSVEDCGFLLTTGTSLKALAALADKAPPGEPIEIPDGGAELKLLQPTCDWKSSKTKNTARVEVQGGPCMYDGTEGNNPVGDLFAAADEARGKRLFPFLDGEEYAVISLSTTDEKLEKRLNKSKKKTPFDYSKPNLRRQTAASDGFDPILRLMGANSQLVFVVDTKNAMFVHNVINTTQKERLFWARTHETLIDPAEKVTPGWGGGAFTSSRLKPGDDSGAWKLGTPVFEGTSGSGRAAFGNGMRVTVNGKKGKLVDSTIPQAHQSKSSAKQVTVQYDDPTLTKGLPTGKPAASGPRKDWSYTKTKADAGVAVVDKADVKVDAIEYVWEDTTWRRDKFPAWSGIRGGDVLISKLPADDEGQHDVMFFSRYDCYQVIKRIPRTEGPAWNQYSAHTYICKEGEVSVLWAIEGSMPSAGSSVERTSPLTDYKKVEGTRLTHGYGSWPARAQKAALKRLGQFAKEGVLSATGKKIAAARSIAKASIPGFLILAKRLGDQGQALACLREPLGVSTGSGKGGPQANATNVFVTIDRLALAAALAYKVPAAIFCYKGGGGYSSGALMIIKKNLLRGVAGGRSSSAPAKRIALLKLAAPTTATDASIGGLKDALWSKIVDAASQVKGTSATARYKHYLGNLLAFDGGIMAVNALDKKGGTAKKIAQTRKKLDSLRGSGVELPSRCSFGAPRSSFDDFREAALHPKRNDTLLPEIERRTCKVILYYILGQIESLYGRKGRIAVEMAAAGFLGRIVAGIDAADIPARMMAAYLIDYVVGNVSGVSEKFISKKARDCAVGHGQCGGGPGYRETIAAAMLHDSVIRTYAALLVRRMLLPNQEDIVRQRAVDGVDNPIGDPLQGFNRGLVKQAVEYISSKGDGAPVTDAQVAKASGEWGEGGSYVFNYLARQVNSFGVTPEQRSACNRVALALQRAQVPVESDVGVIEATVQGALTWNVAAPVAQRVTVAEPAKEAVKSLRRETVVRTPVAAVSGGKRTRRRRYRKRTSRRGKPKRRSRGRSRRRRQGRKKRRRRSRKRQRK